MSDVQRLIPLGPHLVAPQFIAWIYLHPVRVGCGAMLEIGVPSLPRGTVLIQDIVTGHNGDSSEIEITIGHLDRAGLLSSAQVEHLLAGLHEIRDIDGGPYG